MSLLLKRQSNIFYFSSMASYNHVCIMGNTTRDVELRRLPSGMAVTEIGIAVNDRYKNKNDEWVEKTTFVDVTLWSRTAEIAAEYLSKGSPVLIDGRLELDSWEKDGQKFNKLKVIGDKLVLLGGRSGERSNTQSSASPSYNSYSQKQSSSRVEEPKSMDEDCPF